MSEETFKCPRNLAYFLMAIGKNLSGDQLRECIEGARNDARFFGEPSLNSWETMVARWIMADDGMAELYVADHRKGLEALEEQRRTLRWHLDKLTRSDYSVLSELRGIRRNADDAIKAIESAKAETEKP